MENLKSVLLSIRELNECLVEELLSWVNSFEKECVVNERGHIVETDMNTKEYFEYENIYDFINKWRAILCDKYECDIYYKIEEDYILSLKSLIDRLESIEGVE